MAFDYSKLRGRIIEKFGSVASFAEALDTTRQSVYAKLNDDRGLSQEEIIIWADMLDIDRPDYGVYFFTLKVGSV